MTGSGQGDEFSLIQRHFAPLASGLPGALGLADDAAVLPVPEGHELVVTKDVLASGVHFLPDDPPALIARKLLAVNLSDLAAMGAEPLAYALGLVLPRDTTAEWLDAFASGLGEGQTAFGITLAGGDTVAGDGALVLSLTAFGHVPVGTAIRRSGAVPGDAVYVSGVIGDGFLGLEARQGGLGELEGDARADVVRRYQAPEPRLALGKRLRGLASAAVDVSDGLVADLGHLCTASGVSAEVRAADIPVSDVGQAMLSAGTVTYEALLTGGDDYELVFTARPDDAGKIERIASETGIAVSAIGRIGEAPGGLRVAGPDGSPMMFGKPGYSHF